MPELHRAPTGQHEIVVMGTQKRVVTDNPQLIQLTGNVDIDANGDVPVTSDLNVQQVNAINVPLP